MIRIAATTLSVILASTLWRGQEEQLVPEDKLKIQWSENFLTINGHRLPGEIRINYLEAYCRAGSTDRDWELTVIGHSTEQLEGSGSGDVIRLSDTLQDGVIVTHEITAGADEIDFRVTAHNPTDRVSEVHWAQPCIRVDKFTGCTTEDARELVPDYARKCFVFFDGELTRLPTKTLGNKGPLYARPSLLS